jgi:hypothetical protein
MKHYKIFILFTIVVSIFSSCERIEENEQEDPPSPPLIFLPKWEEGFLDIHAINTGRGESTFIIMPDGTTMLIDAASSLLDTPELLARPNPSRSPGEWISRYITHFMEGYPEPKLDYFILTHFHPDHMGGYSDNLPMSSSLNFRLSGITEVGEFIPFNKLIDRNWPDYDYPKQLLPDNRMDNYIEFLNWNIANNNVSVEQFDVGRSDQITLTREPGSYPDFKVQNIASNGFIWTGEGSTKQNHFPDLETLVISDYPSENHCSIAFKISYGDFDYFSGADICFNGMSDNPWKDIETPVASVTGQVDVMKANHHGTWDANGDSFLAYLQPRVIVIHTWRDVQPRYETLNRMTSQTTYTGPRDIFVTNVSDSKRIELGENIAMLKSTQGHVVIRIEHGGEEYKVYVLDDSDERYKVKKIYGPYTSK